MQGKVVLVTGANGGLGRYVAQSFLDAGATVVGNSRKIQQSDFSGANFVALPGGVRYLRPGDPGSPQLSDPSGLDPRSRPTGTFAPLRRSSHPRPYALAD